MTPAWTTPRRLVGPCVADPAGCAHDAPSVAGRSPATGVAGFASHAHGAATAAGPRRGQGVVRLGWCADCGRTFRLPVVPVSPKEDAPGGAVATRQQPAWHHCRGQRLLPHRRMLRFVPPLRLTTAQVLGLPLACLVLLRIAGDGQDVRLVARCFSRGLPILAALSAGVDASLPWVGYGTPRPAWFHKPAASERRSAPL